MHWMQLATVAMVAFAGGWFFRGVFDRRDQGEPFDEKDDDRFN